MWASINFIEEALGDEDSALAFNEQWAAEARELAGSLRRLAPTPWLAELDKLIGRLPATMQIEYPKLPPPEWLSGSGPPAS